MRLRSITSPDVYCCRMYSYQYFIVLGSRFFYLFELKNFRWSVFVHTIAFIVISLFALICYSIFIRF